TMTDELEHFRARAAARPEEDFARSRLFGAHLLAFRAYGDIRHLDQAREVANGPDALASLHLAEHDFQGALAAARQADAASGGAGRETARYRLFDALWAVGSKGEAAEILDGPLDTLSTGYLSRKARVLDGQGHTEAARDVFRRVVENVRAYAEPAPVEAWALVELGHFELHSGDPDAAVKQYLAALEVLPGSPAAIEGLAAVALGVDRNLAAARDLYRKALANGGHLDIMPTLADLEEALGNTGESLRIRRDFVAQATADPRSQAMHRRPLVFLLAESAATRGEAVRQARLDLAARQDQGSFDALAWALYREGEVQMAWTLEQRALAAGGPPPTVLFRAGIIADAAGVHDRAVELLEEALEGRVELGPWEEEAALQILHRAAEGGQATAHGPVDPPYGEAAILTRSALQL
ncbi:MAG: tetratricopeptide repeat protein, partial [Longimicrobiales bacterium]|nr:tetratricopeptide repeat protein [Longimicrobiales bacterium]